MERRHKEGRKEGIVEEGNKKNREKERKVSSSPLVSFVLCKRIRSEKERNLRRKIKFGKNFLEIYLEKGKKKRRTREFLLR